MTDEIGDPPSTPPELLDMPGYLARRLYQAYVAYWGKNVDPVLTGPQFSVMTAVRMFPGSDQGSMAVAVALDNSTMADLARRLETRGFLTRVPDSADGRRKLLYLSPEGEAVLDKATARVAALSGPLLSPLPEDERVAFTRTLQRLADHWEKLASD
ncbi:MarR family winged helix-turn-helix transcriptional regulator [Rhodococcus coprophilus]|uniref:MarR family transcriptional regulator n=1 Tax=Rhodococcus coprophilus TaxID=38310 RepID=A0A2X4TU45_9NOCA|nr:MarR family winged helix-turn-helix transcriptional regulator [Rhodococcus coprophilus]MBM7458028.1 DNA-binding MarR family transcriptional regulator [Rhodococcus coprophilus]SQI30947.1 MarR family transcriptional regulator [Rhodococcus coprophilus]